jgi:hypothetical protein
MTGDPIGDSGVCFGDPNLPCIVCQCTYCGSLTAACATDTACATAETAFNKCSAMVPSRDPVSLAPCRDTANASSPKAGPYLDCVIAACADICL